MEIVSSAFEYDESIPRIYTCQGRDFNFPLEFRDVPKEAKSLALIMEDPDVPRSLRKDGLYVHWVIFNMDPKTRKIEENAKKPGTMGITTGRVNTYEGPCPPDREHRYFIRLYALDSKLDLKEGATKDELLQAMEGHIIDQAELMGRYEKS